MEQFQFQDQDPFDTMQLSVFDTYIYFFSIFV